MSLLPEIGKAHVNFSTNGVVDDKNDIISESDRCRLTTTNEDTVHAIIGSANSLPASIHRPYNYIGGHGIGLGTVSLYRWTETL